jgi:hypothetical protein
MSDIEWVLGQLETLGHSVSGRPVNHGTLYWVDGHPIPMTNHHPGRSQIKPTYVDRFIDVMVELELYEE